MKHRLNFSQSLSVHAKKVADNLSYQLLLSLVPKVGLEPTRCRQHRILSPASIIIKRVLLYTIDLKKAIVFWKIFYFFFKLFFSL